MLNLNPPLLNSSNRWATTEAELEELYTCPYTGALTIRTSLISGFLHRDKVHQHCFFEAQSLYQNESKNLSNSDSTATSLSSLNTLGYSPTPLPKVIEIVVNIQLRHGVQKPVIFSITGDPLDVAECYHKIRCWNPIDRRWLVEINLSCPNIPNKPPPAYSQERLQEYLEALQSCLVKTPTMQIGLKTPPYTYQGQFDALIGALGASRGPCPISFITATNTLGSCFVSSDSGEPAINSAAGTGIGGMAGAALHPLALGNVKTIRRMLDERPALKHIEIIGTGGVLDHAGYQRMRTVGAAAVGVGTGLGAYGVGVFEKILHGEKR